MSAKSFKITDTFVKQLTAATGPGNVLTDEADRLPYGYDNSRLQALPSAVVFATTHEQVKRIVGLCNEHKFPLVTRGRGTGTTGAAVPIEDAIVLSLERMENILRLDPENRVMVVQPGVTNLAVQEAAAAHHLFWPPDPTSAATCTVGGNLACNAAGPRAVKYGTARENTLGLRAVIGSGEEIRTGVYTTKGVVGYDLTRLLIGSEGTLAVITEATLKLTPLQPARRTLRAVYQDISGAATAISRIMGQAVIPCALEFMDGMAIEMVRNISEAELPRGAGALLMIEVDGTVEAIDSTARTVADAARVDGLIELETAASDREVAALWATRRALSPALRNIAPKKINEDVVVPVSRVPELINGLQNLAGEFGITIVNFGHAGNGNIHVNLLIDPDDPGQVKNANICLEKVFDLVLSLTGTLSGEHGIGLVKRDMVAREIDPVSLDLMRRIKAQFDPNGILNPHKTIPD
ncbi:MAG: FAD-linked oxidase C-terminal domain-containing protein [Gammaproteobacteria bacterium]